MAKIERLAEAQHARLQGFYDEMLAAGLSTASADRPVAEAAITGLYGELRRPSPQFLWFPSPMCSLVAIGLLKHASAGQSRRANTWAMGTTGTAARAAAVRRTGR